MGAFGVGRPVRRKEDRRYLTGAGCFTDDLNEEGQVHAVFLRSPHAHALIRGIDTAGALSFPGVVGIVTGTDLADLGTLPTEADLKDRAGRPMFKPERRVLPTDRVRFVGEPVAMVLADTLEAARDAAEAIAVDYAPQPAAVGTADALELECPLVWPENDRGNLVVHWENRDGAAVERLLAGAHRRVSVRIVNNRLVPSPMEPRAALAVHEAASGRTTLFCPSQGGRRIQTVIAREILRVPPEQVRVVSCDTGGSFGIRSKVYPELALVAWAARRFGRPVKWRGDRSETFLADYHGRDQVNRAEMGLDETGRVIALKVETLINVGAYLSENGPRLPINGGGRIIPCAYDIESFHFSVRPVFTHTVPTDTYRGAGRPEANFIMERLMDVAAEACDLSRSEIRRRNLISPAKLPYRTQMGLMLDSGDFAGTMDKALAAADWSGFPERRARSEAEGRLRGIGIGCFIEAAGGRPTEEMRVRVKEDGATVFAGTYSHGQGHETVYAQLVSDLLGVPFADVRLQQGDSALAPKGSAGSFGSRTSMMGGIALKRACERVIEKGRAVAGRLLQSGPDTVEFCDGMFFARGASVSLKEVAGAARDARHLPEGMAPGLDESFLHERPADDLNFPNGCHVCEVEVDPDVGTVEILRYTAVDDCGVVLNPLIVHGQIHGGVAQGIGQALTEAVVFDESGQPLTGSYMDYGLPRAGDLPAINTSFNPVPCCTNELGVKGAGEAGACAAPSALVSAVTDALRPLGIKHIDMPLTPSRVWRAITDARSAGERSTLSK